MTRNLWHQILAQLWFKDEVADGACIIKKVESADDRSNIGNKFQFLTHKLIICFIYMCWKIAVGQ